MRAPLLLLLGLSCAPSPAPRAPAPGAAPDPAPDGRLQRQAQAAREGRASIARIGLALPAPAQPGADPGEVALAWARQQGPDWGLSPGALEGLVERRRVPMPSGGAVLRLGIDVEGRPVSGAELNLLVDGEGRPRVWSRGARLEAGLAAAPRPEERELSMEPEEAVAIALDLAYGLELSPGPLRAEEGADGWLRLSPAGGGGLRRPARLRPLWWPEDGLLRSAWEIELMGDEAGGAAWRLILAQRDGALLHQKRLSAHAHTYRVWADSAGDYRPADAPTTDMSPHPTGSPDGTMASSASSSLITMEGFNTNPSGGVDPWLEPAATESSGNNVDAHVDRDGTDGLSGTDFRAAISSAATFDYTYDLLLSPIADQEQGMAAVVQAFYTTNWLHDWYYDSGFVESAANAQLSNYGRGGEEADAMLVQVQDRAEAGSRNNANMSTPSDGEAPRMQIYIWSGDSDSSLEVSGLGELAFSSASYGPDNYDLTAELVRVSGTGCTSIVEDVAGAIAVVDRGGCNFIDKSAYAQSAGAVALIVINNVPGSFGLGGTGSSTLPTVGISQADGATLSSAIAAGPTTARLMRVEQPEVDAALDASIVAHEWGHYLHHRLSECGTTQCGGMSEGWADFTALHLMLEDGDDLSGAFAAGGYSAVASADDPLYYGVRRVPYSVDTSKNALSFRHISNGEALPTGHPMASGPADNAEVHNAGEIWATALWEVYIALQQDRDSTEGFDDRRRRMSDIVVAGLALAPDEATFTETRDALLAATAVIDPTDLSTAAEAFARRGMGSCALSPDRDSDDLTGVVEDYTVGPNVTISSFTYADGERSCDDDGVLDRGEMGLATVVITNTGGADLSGATLQLSASHASISFPDGDSISLPALAPWEAATVELPVALDRSVTPLDAATLTATLTASDACEVEQSEEANLLLDADLQSAASAIDSFDADDGTWTLTGDEASRVWGRIEESPLSWSWLGVDVTGITDTQLLGPVMEASATDPLILQLSHRWSFEYSGGTYWDGGVIELSVAGADWVDLSTFVDPGYSGVLTSEASNPLADRWAYSATNPTWPAYESSTYDLGTALAGQTFQLRFRVGTDPGVSDYGWELAELGISGITSTPFPAWVAQVDACDPPPLADAGPDQVVDSGAEVVLDGSASSDPWGEPFTFAWADDSGALALDDPSSASPQLLAPVVEVETTYTLTLTVDDGLSSSIDAMLLTVRPPPEDTGGDTGTAEGGDGSTDGGSADSGSADSGGTEDGSGDGGSSDGSPADSGGAEGAGDTGTNGAEGGADEEGEGSDKSGCACSSAGSPAAAMGLLGALALGLRPRRD